MIDDQVQAKKTRRRGATYVHRSATYFSAQNKFTVNFVQRWCTQSLDLIWSRKKRAIVLARSKGIGTTTVRFTKLVRCTSCTYCFCSSSSTCELRIEKWDFRLFPLPSLHFATDVGSLTMMSSPPCCCCCYCCCCCCCYCYCRTCCFSLQKTN